MRWVLGISVAAAIALIICVPVFRKSPSRLAASLVISIVYGFSIGGANVVVLSRYASRITARRAPFNWLLLAATLVILTAIGTLIAGLVLVALGLYDPQDYWPTFRRDMRYGWIVAIAIGVSIALYERLSNRLETTQQALGEKEVVAERAGKLAVEARLSSLESRIHPHFLFNTLNSISALIQEDPARAEKMVERLAALLRFSLDSDQQRTVALEKEMKITADYLEIERARFGERLRYSIDVPEALAELQTPALAVQTLVENSLKHAIAPRREGGEVTITARLHPEKEGSRLRIEVADDGPGFGAEAMAAGHGLDNLQARLAALYGDAAALEVATHGRYTVVAISLPAGGRIEKAGK